MHLLKLIATGSSLLAAALLASASARADVTVMLDQAKVIRLPPGTATIIIGNPAIADVTIQRSGIGILTGKTYGMTNMIVLNSTGETIREEEVIVKPGDQSIVTVQRGLERESLACTPNCERTVKLGDAPANFDAVTGQANARSGLATSGAAPK